MPDTEDIEPPTALLEEPRAERTVTADEIRRGLDLVVVRSLPPIAAGLCALYFLLAASHGLLLPRSLAIIMAPTALFSALFHLAAYGIMRRHPRKPHFRSSESLDQRKGLNAKLDVHPTGP